MTNVLLARKSVVACLSNAAPDDVCKNIPGTIRIPDGMPNRIIMARYLPRERKPFGA